ncbi:acyl-ACP desaturase [Flavisolibacter tropicus]|uniref:Fatty acid desaturase n=1 Tax=Flavisolibacter tropicus TaxID=1492898 RepID=A0A172TX80_9BACT|nr:acyl-ACP desaturase [Flavisolibacter tropicus]ANE51592.1 fatty acid desaturase [Flavisolibacter tropicus]
MQNVSKISRAEVMNHLDKEIQEAILQYLKPIDDIWQPADLLPQSDRDDFFDQVKELKARAATLSYDLVAVLIGDTITEEALPTYESWLMQVKGPKDDPEGGWHQWVRNWTAEENRHGDVLNTYLYLSGRVNMRQLQISTQYLLADGFDIGTAHDPYRNFVYTSFQEMATNLSHRRVAQFAKKAGDEQLAKICGHVASDEMRHANAYKSFVSKILLIDPSEMMVAFEDMMRKKIVMPAHFLREMGMAKGETFAHFSEAAQRIGVYTALDYVAILKVLLKEWKIDSLTNLNEAGEKARDYLMKLPDRLFRLAERINPKPSSYKFSWIV